jgi:hypothetical protein
LKSTTKQLLAIGCTFALCSLAVFGQGRRNPEPQESRGLIRNLPGAFQGYTIVSPLRSTSAYLVDMKGEIVHEWKSRYTPTSGIYLLPNGSLLRAARDPNNHYFSVGGSGGIVQEIAWDGTVAWEYVYSSRQHVHHHDIELLPNGNILLLAWERKSAQEALMAGRDPQMISGLGLWTDHVVEVRPRRPRGGEIVWEWHLWDHLIQNRDPRLKNYGKVEEHPELVNINGDLGHRRESDEELARLRALGYIADSPQPSSPQQRSDKQKADWVHANSVSYNPKLDQIVVSALRFGEIWIIDHSTSTAEAASHSGGKGGRGGDLLYRWGNPQSYRGAEFASHQQLFSQHDARWIPDGFRGEGNLTVYNNGRGRPEGEYSSVDEIRLPRKFNLASGPKGRWFSPSAERVWSFAGSSNERFFSGHVSGAERLPNGNTLVCVGEQGRIFEVTPGGEIVWDYLNPIAGDPSENLPPWQPATDSGSHDEETLYGLQRANRIPADHPGLAALAASASD